MYRVVLNCNMSSTRIGLKYGAMMNPDTANANGTGEEEMSVSFQLHREGVVHAFSASAPGGTQWDKYEESGYNVPFSAHKQLYEEWRVKKFSIKVDTPFTAWINGGMNQSGTPLSQAKPYVSFHYERSNTAGFVGDGPGSTRNSMNSMTFNYDYNSKPLGRGKIYNVKYMKATPVQGYVGTVPTGQLPLKAFNSIKGGWSSTDNTDCIDYGYLDVNIHNAIPPNKIAVQADQTNVSLYTFELRWELEFRKPSSNQMTSQLLELEDNALELYCDKMNSS